MRATIMSDLKKKKIAELCDYDFVDVKIIEQKQQEKRNELMESVLDCAGLMMAELGLGAMAAGKKLFEAVFDDEIKAKQLKDATHWATIKQIQQPQQTIDTMIEGFKIDNMQRLMAAYLTKAKVGQESAKATFIENVLTNIKIEALPSTLQTYIVSTIFNPTGTQFNDFEMQEQIKDYIKQETQAKADTASAQAENLRLENEFKKWKQDQAKNKREP